MIWVDSVLAVSASCSCCRCADVHGAARRRACGCPGTAGDQPDGFGVSNRPRVTMPMRSHSASGRHHDGSRTCVRRHAAHRVRRGRTVTAEPSSWRTRRVGAHDHGRSRPAQPGQASTPAARSASACSRSSTMITATVLPAQIGSLVYHRDCRQEANSCCHTGPKRLSTRDTRGYAGTGMTNMNTEHSLLAEHQHRPSCSPCRRARTPSRPARRPHRERRSPSPRSPRRMPLNRWGWVAGEFSGESSGHDGGGGPPRHGFVVFWSAFVVSDQASVAGEPAGWVGRAARCQQRAGPFPRGLPPNRT